MNNPKTISISSIVDNHLSIMQGALFQSIQENYKGSEKIDYYVITDNLSQSNKNNLSQNITKINLIWIDIDDVVPKNINLPVDKSSFPINVYTRLFIPYIVKSGVEKVIYLDVDMIAVEDISKLWEIDLGTHPVAGVLDRSKTVNSKWGGIPNYIELGLDENTSYYNSGMFVFNINLWLKEKYAEKIVNCLMENIKFSSFPINYGMNVVFANKWLTLDPKWNAYAMEDIKEPYIIHFAGRKPIFSTYDYNQEFKEVFYNYVEKTAWKGFKPIGEQKRLIKKLFNKIEKRIKHLFS